MKRKYIWFILFLGLSTSAFSSTYDMFCRYGVIDTNDYVLSGFLAYERGDTHVARDFLVISKSKEEEQPILDLRKDNPPISAVEAIELANKYWVELGDSEQISYYVRLVQG